MKKPLSKVEKICILSLIVSFGSILLLNLSAKKVNSIWYFLIIVGIITFSTLVTLICSVSMVYTGVKKSYSDWKRKPFEFFIGLWRGLNILAVIGAVFVVILFISPKMRASINANSYLPFQITYVFFAVGTILSAIVVYGLNKRNIVGYYSSMVRCVFSIFNFILFAIFYKEPKLYNYIFDVVLVSINIFIIYYIRRNKKYFKIVIDIK